MQPSHDEIQREVENLRDIRRRSTAQGGPGPFIDPDLPTPAAQTASQAGYWSPSTDDSSSDSHSHEDGSEHSVSSADDPFHLFWVPARMHPEIDPAEFRQFLKEHARAPAEGSTPVLARAGSTGGTGLGRKKSMLSRQYQPSANDSEDEDEKVVPLRRNRSSLYQSTGPQLTIKDLERLDELAEEATQSSDPTRLRSVLRRSLSMNMSPSAIDKMDDVPDMGDEADAPIIVPRPGQILRRAARTKIRKPGQTGEGAHRFNATRRGSAGARSVASVAAATIAATAAASAEPRTSGELSTSDHSDTDHVRRQRTISSNSAPDEVPRLVRPDSYSAETFIIDAYAADEDDDKGPIIVSPISPNESFEFNFDSSFDSSSPFTTEPEPIPLALPLPPIQQPVQSPIIHQPTPQRSPSLPNTIVEPLRSPSPENKRLYPGVDTPVPASASPAFATTTPTRPATLNLSPNLSPSGPASAPLQPRASPEPQPGRASPSSSISHEHRKEKDKKGLFKWGDKKSKKEKEKEREREREKEREKEKEKDSGFFGSLFGSKKKQEESAPPGHGHSSGREAAVALLGASKTNKGYVPPSSPQPSGVNNYSRYPIHVERAIYRLSHIKLANPRRPLYEQVLISNLMFWYLGVINKTQTQGQAQGNSAAANGADQPQATSATDQQREREREEKEREERERKEREQAERERQEQKSQSRRGSLTKNPPAQAGGRRAEMAVRGPQYDMQHRAMEQEYGPLGRSSASAGPPGYAGGYSNPGSPSYNNGTPQQQSRGSDNQYGVPPGSPGRGEFGQQPQQQQWQARQALGPRSQQTIDPPRSSSPPSGGQAYVHTHGRSRSPPPQTRFNVVQDKQSLNSTVVGRTPSRSASASASPSPPPINGKPRKAISAHAIPPNHGRVRTSEEEDVPLAFWQQQQQAQRRR